MFAQTLFLERIPFEEKKIAMSCDVGENQWVDMTYGELKEMVDEVKKILMMIGVKKGDRIILFGENHYKWIPVFLGITSYGAVAVPLDGVIADSRMLALFEDCQPAAIVVSKKFQDRLMGVAKKFAKPCNIVNFHFDLLKVYEEIAPISELPPPPTPDEIAAIIYTSGTTGKPKGVMLSHKALVASVRIGVRIGSVESSDVFLTILPFTHVFGLVAAGLVPLTVGARVILAATFNPVHLFAAIQKFKVNYILAVPRLADVLAGTLHQQNVMMPHLKMFIGGAACSSQTINMLRARGVQAVQGYGMTETCGGIVACLSGPIESVGQPYEEIEFKIDNPQNGVGELLVSAPTLLTGIFNDPKQTKEVFSGRFLRTGDLAAIDDKGFLYLKGRLKDVIIPPGGVNVYPDELELRLGLLPFLEEYAVIGLHESGSEYPILVVKPRKEFFAAQPGLVPEEYIHQAIEKISADWPDWEKFRRLVVVNQSLPRSASQKVQRNLLQTHIAGQAPVTGARAVTAEPGQKSEGSSPTGIKGIFGKFQAVVGHFLNVFPEEITEKRLLADFLQLDSLGIVALISRLEAVFETPLRNVRQEDLGTFGALFGMVLRESPQDLLEKKVVSPDDLPALPPLLDASREAVKRRQQFLQTLMKNSVKVIPIPDEPETFAGNIEGFCGFAQIPLGIAGPLRIHGEHAKGDFFLPLATTEGALVASVSRGAQIVTAAGGVHTRIIADSLVRAPIAIFRRIEEVFEFSVWLKEHFAQIKAEAETTTRFGKLETIEEFIMGTSLCMRFVFSTGDASGQNMTTIATHKAIDFIRREFPGKIADLFLESNLSGDKKINGVNFTRNRGKKVVAEVEIPRDLVEKSLHTTPERIAKLTEISMMTALHSHSFGSQAHFANLLAALFIATGQDAACVAESATGVTHIQMRGDGLAMSVTMPGLMVGTVGGGTRLPTQAACLQMIDCDGPRKARKLAEITAAGVLAAEISLIGAMAADEFAGAHAKYGRSAPAK
jgi:hydroxymethylglutaryl-CoA reductase (NADPH)